jgi:hypothetical protein
MATTISRNLNSDIYNYINNSNESHKLTLPVILHNHAFSSRSLHINPSLKRILIHRRNNNSNNNNVQPTAEHTLRVNQVSMIVNKRKHNHNVLHYEHSMSNSNISSNNKKVYPLIYKQLQTYRKHNIIHNNSSVNCHKQQLPKFNMKVFNYSYSNSNVHGSSPCIIAFKIKDYNGIKNNSSSV